MSADARKQSSNRISVTNHDAIDTANFARLRGDAQSARRAHQCKGRLWSRTGDLQGGGSPWLGERTVSYECATPCSLSITDCSRDDLGWQTSNRSILRVDQSGLPCQRFTIVEHTNQIAIAFPQTTCADDRYLGIVAVDLCDVLAQSPCRVSGIQFHFDGDLAGVDMQSAREAKDRRDFGLPTTGFVDRDPAQFIFYGGGHRHGRYLTLSAPKMWRNAGANFSLS